MSDEGGNTSEEEHEDSKFCDPFSRTGGNSVGTGGHNESGYGAGHNGASWAESSRMSFGDTSFMSFEPSFIDELIDEATDQDSLAELSLSLMSGVELSAPPSKTSQPTSVTFSRGAVPQFSQ